MIVTTTGNVEGKTVTAYLGIVTGEAIMGTNVFKDFFAGIRDIVGGRSGRTKRKRVRQRMLRSKTCWNRLKTSVPMPSSAWIWTMKLSAAMKRRC